MTRLCTTLIGLAVLLVAIGVPGAGAQRGETRADAQRPTSFPHRILAASWPGDFELAEQPPPKAFWRAARAIPGKDGQGKVVSLVIDPARPVGAHTKLRFRYHLSGASALTLQVFDFTVKDNRSVNLTNLKQGEWTTRYVDFSRDSRRNDGTDAPFSAGNTVDALFFFVRPEGRQPVELYVDEVVLFDAGEAGSPAR